MQWGCPSQWKQQRGCSGDSYVRPHSSPSTFPGLGVRTRAGAWERQMLVGRQGPPTSASAASFQFFWKRASNPQIRALVSNGFREMEHPRYAASVGQTGQATPDRPSWLGPRNPCGKSHLPSGHLTSTSCGVWCGLASRPSRRCRGRSTQGLRCRPGIMFQAGKVQPGGSRLPRKGLACAGSAAPSRRAAATAAVLAACTYSLPRRLLCGTPKGHIPWGSDNAESCHIPHQECLLFEENTCMAVAGTTDHLHPLSNIPR